MAAGTYDFTIEQGASFTREIIWKNNAAVPVPYNLTGFTARMQVRSSITAPAILLELTTENGRVSLGTSNGKITLILTAAETAAFAWITGVYDLEIIDVAGKVTRLLKGTVAVDPEITR